MKFFKKKEVVEVKEETENIYTTTVNKEMLPALDLLSSIRKNLEEGGKKEEVMVAIDEAIINALRNLTNWESCVVPKEIATAIKVKKYAR